MSQLQKEIDLAASVENLEREANRRFGPNVHVTFTPELPLDKIVAKDEDNHRFASGQTIGGVTLKGDLRNIPGMAEEIRNLRGIQTPVVVCLRDNGEYRLKQGFRRVNGAKLIVKEEPGSPLAVKLERGIPAIVYTGLSMEQERTLINDQTSKPFSLAEVWNIFREEIEGGYNWLTVCERMYRQIGQVTGSLDKVRDLDSIPKADDRQKALRKWLNSFAYQGWVCGIKSGPRIKNLWLQTYLWKDKFEGANRPPVVMDTNRQKALTSAILDDQTAGEWRGLIGSGPRCDELLRKFEAEDAKKYNADGTKRKTEKEEVEGVRPFKEIQELILREEEATSAPTLLSRVFRISMKKGGDPEACKLIRHFEKCRNVFSEYRAYMPEKLVSTLALVLDGVEGSEETLARLCMDNLILPLPSSTLPSSETHPESADTPETPSAVTAEPPVAMAAESPSEEMVVKDDAPETFNLVEHTDTKHKKNRKR